ncbi:hypothetical protein YT1_0244 [Rhodococcus ruber]|nr:hypothetical protein YT1_0244 [Rhodococcus ruber]
MVTDELTPMTTSGPTAGMPRWTGVRHCGPRLRGRGSEPRRCGRSAGQNIRGIGPGMIYGGIGV